MTTRIIALIARGSLLAAVILSTAACGDFFYDAPPATDGNLALGLVFAELPGGMAAASAPEVAFDKADRVSVLVTAGEDTLFDETIDLLEDGNDQILDVSIPLAEETTLTVEVDMLLGVDPLFSGSTTRTVTPGEDSQIEVPLSPIANGLDIPGGDVLLGTIGETVQLSARTLFATGDPLQDDVPANWSISGTGAEISSNGLLTALENGSGTVTAEYQGFNRSIGFEVFDPCTAAPTVIQFGASVDGSFTLNDCVSPFFFPVDFYLVENVPNQVPIRITMTANDYSPAFVVDFPEGRRISGWANPSDPTVDVEHVLPGGTYLMIPQTIDEGTSPTDIATGPYTFSTMFSTSEAQVGCQAETQVVSGVSLSATLTDEDCFDEFNPQEEGVRRFDGFNVMLTDEATSVTATVTPDFYSIFSRWNNGQFIEAIDVYPGETGSLTGTQDEALFHQFFVINFFQDTSNPNLIEGGPYTISFSGPGGAQVTLPTPRGGSLLRDGPVRWIRGR